MELAEKLQIPPGARVYLVAAPKVIVNALKTTDQRAAAAVLVFAANSRALTASAGPAIDAAREDRLSWIAYPKAGQMGTDLNRDKLVDLMKPHGIEGVRLVSIDEVWSAMRFRPTKEN